MKIYKFRNFYFNLTERRLLKNGKYLDLTTKTFDILQLLIESGGEIVTKDEILGKVWNGSFVEEGNLPVHISKLRRLLNETKELPFIETVQGSGYRFVAPINEAKVSDWEKISSDTNYSPSHEVSKEWKFDSIAVLPLENESADPEIEYLADGLSESFINSLSRLPNLKVIARNTVFRYKNKNADIKEIAETLGVATVLTGRIRVVKDHLIIGIELSKADDGTQLWGINFNRSFTDIFEIQESIITEVLERLKSEINNSLKSYDVNPITKNPESYRLYLKGKFLREIYTKDNLYKAIEYFHQSVSHDPLNVYSYVEIIESLFSLYFSEQISYLDILEKINPLMKIISTLNQSVDVVQAMHAGKCIYLDWNFEAGKKHLVEALALNPNCLIAHHRFSDLLLLSGKYFEALKEIQLIISIDPLSFPNYKRIGRLLYKMGQFETAINYLNDALELEPRDYVILAILGAAYTELGNYDKALSIFQKSLDCYFNIEIASMIGYVYALQGEKERALQIIRQIESEPEEISQPGIKQARIYMALGEKETAYKLLEQAYEQHNVDFMQINFDPRWNAIRHESRFKEIASRLRFPKD